MSASETRLAEDRETRNAARAVFETRVARVKGALTERGIGKRIANDALRTGKGLADEALAVTKDEAGIVAATALILIGWLARRPLGRAAGKLATLPKKGEPASVWERLRGWATKRIET